MLTARFSRIFPHLDWIRRGREYLSEFSLNEAKCGKNVDQNNSKYVHFLCKNVGLITRKHLEEVKLAVFLLWCCNIWINFEILLMLEVLMLLIIKFQYYKLKMITILPLIHFYFLLSFRYSLQKHFQNYIFISFCLT